MIRVLLHRGRRRSTPSPGPRTWLSDTDLVAGDGEAADLVSYIRADETPHVDYLKTALTEMRDRTWVGTDGKKHEGTEMIGTLWDRGLDAVPRRGPGPDPQGRPRRGRALVPASATTAPTSSPSSTPLADPEAA